MADQGRPPLPIERTDRGIVIKRRSLDVREGLDIARALIDTADAAPHERDPAEVPGIAGDQDVPRIAESFANLADQVAWVGGTEHRNDNVGPLGDAPDAERDAEIVLMIRKLSPPSGNVHESG